MPYLSRLVETAALEDKLNILRSKWDLLKVQFPRVAKIPDQDLVWKHLVDADPTPNKQYLQWIIVKGISKWKNKPSYRFLEDLASTMFDLLGKYKKLSDKKALKPEHRDINRLPDLDALFEVVVEYQDVSLDNDKAIELKFYANKEATLIHDSAAVKIVAIHSEKASCFFGRNTQWCTAATNHNQFRDYNKRGTLYIILDKAKNKRWQFWQRKKDRYDIDFMDEHDEEVDPIEWKKNPISREVGQAVKPVLSKVKSSKVWTTVAQNYPVLVNAEDLTDEEMARFYYSETARNSNRILKSLFKFFPITDAVLEILKALPEGVGKFKYSRLMFCLDRATQDDIFYIVKNMNPTTYAFEQYDITDIMLIKLMKQNPAWFVAIPADRYKPEFFDIFKNSIKKLKSERDLVWALRSNRDFPYRGVNGNFIRVILDWGRQKTNFFVSVVDIINAISKRAFVKETMQAYLNAIDDLPKDELEDVVDKIFRRSVFIHTPIGPSFVKYAVDKVIDLKLNFSQDTLQILYRHDKRIRILPIGRKPFILDALTMEGHSITLREALTTIPVVKATKKEIMEWADGFFLTTLSYVSLQTLKKHEKELVDVLKFFKQYKDIVVKNMKWDLRNNKGGAVFGSERAPSYQAFIRKIFKDASIPETWWTS